MKTGRCPKCSSDNIYSGASMPFKTGTFNVNTIPVTGRVLPTYVALDNYVCVTCGYVESYISDPTALERIPRYWPKVELQPRAFRIKKRIHNRNESK